MSLDTLVDVDAAIAAVLSEPMPTKPSAVRIRASRLADLYDVQAVLFEIARDNPGDQIPGIYVAACGHAAAKARATAKFFRGQAESRRVRRAR